MKVGARADYLTKRAQGIAGYFQDGTDKYNEEAARVYGLLREAWEAFVEEELFSGVVTRFRSSVQTLRLNEVEIEDADIHRLDLNMSKASTWMTGHDKSKALHEERPSPTELIADIEVLSTFVKDVKARRATTKKHARRNLRRLRRRRDDGPTESDPHQRSGDVSRQDHGLGPPEWMPPSISRVHGAILGMGLAQPQAGRLIND